MRAEGMRTAGCSFDVFIATMKEDDAFDADLTVLGRSQVLQPVFTDAVRALPACGAIGGACTFATRCSRLASRGHWCKS